MVSPKKAASLCLAALITLAFSVVMSVSVCAQVAGATLSGGVFDPSGAPVPKSQLSIKNVATGVIESVTTDAAGYYTAPNLLPGTYEVSVKAPGFATSVQSGIALTVGAQQVLNVTLRVGTASETIRVIGSAPAVELATETISSTVNETAMQELPLNGRDWTSLSVLTAGVTALSQVQTSIQADGGNGRSYRGFGNQVAISGSRPQANNYRIDGISVNDYQNGGPGGVSGVGLGVDTIGEFSVLTSNYTAEYGNTGGGVINAISRSGTNQFHGDAFEYLRNSSLDAANFFDDFSNSPKPAFRRNQFGGAVGGPIWKDHAFFFGSYEGFRQTLGLTTVSTVPSLDARNGIIHNLDGTTTTVSVDPLVAPFLGLWHVPNGPLFPPGNTGIYSFSAPQVTSENFASARVDYKISEKDSLFGTWQYDAGNTRLPDSLDDVLNTTATGRQLYMLEETHTFSAQLLNSVRAGVTRSVSMAPKSATAINSLAANAALGTAPGRNAGAISVSGGGTAFSGGVGSIGHTDFAGNTLQVYDDAFLLRGIHSLKFGFAFEGQQCNCSSISYLGTRWRFNSLTDFLTNLPASVQGPLAGAFPERGFRDSLFGAYIQDSIKWRPNFTIDLGLRYEPSRVPYDIRGKTASLVSPYAPQVHLGSPLFANPTLKNFAPRVGFAWDPFRNGKTSVRAGFGIFDMLPLVYQIQDTELNSAPWSLNVSAPASALVQGSFPVAAFAAAVAQSSLLRTSYIQQNPKRSYIMTWNLSVQRALTPSLTATASYVGSHGVHLIFHADDTNDVLPTLTSAGYLWPQNIGSGTVQNPTIGKMETTTWGNSSFYDGLQSQLTKRMSHGLQLQAAYSWSKAIDYGSATNVADNFINSISSLFIFDPRFRRSASDFNVGQNLTINYDWFVPAPRSLHGPAAWGLGGWEIGGILTVQSGLPFTPNLGGSGNNAGGDPLGLNNSDPFDFPNRLTGPGCQSLVNPGNVTDYLKLQCFGLPMATPAIAANCTPFSGATVPGTCQNLLGNLGRNAVIGPGLANFDFSLIKNNYIKRISENFDVQFRAEFFNVLNHPSFLPPLDNSTIFDTTGAPVGGAGLIDATSTPAREIQFALKVIW